eukprot:gene8692-biopygen12154
MKTHTPGSIGAPPPQPRLDSALAGHAPPRHAPCAHLHAPAAAFPPLAGQQLPLPPACKTAESQFSRAMTSVFKTPIETLSRECCVKRSLGVCVERNSFGFYFNRD